MSFIFSFGFNAEKFNKSLDSQPSSSTVEESFSVLDEFFMYRLTHNKFMNDKAFHVSDRLCIVFEGVVLNSQFLYEKYKRDSVQACIIHLYEEYGESFIEYIEGSFCGVILDRDSQELHAFTDKIGTRQIYYMNSSEGILISNDLHLMNSFMKSEAISCDLDVESSYCLLSQGFMLGNRTLFKQVRKIEAGCILNSQENTSLRIKRYYQLENTPNYNLSYDEIIERVDVLFRNAVRKAFDKDLEYGYKHLVGLSGGLDSRMTTWVANDLGYGTNIVNFTFSESGYLDETIAKNIARKLKHTWIFKSLDNGVFLKDIDNVTKISGGNALYYGLAHSKSMFDNLDTSGFGIVHTGQLGDVVLGTFFSKPSVVKDYDISSGAYSTFLFDKVAGTLNMGRYENEELFKFYARGFNGANQGLVIAQQFSETFSPFYDLDFMEFCLSIPPKFRYGHKIYIDWVIRKYPDAADFVWEKTGSKINARFCNVFGRTIYLDKLPSLLLNQVKRRLFRITPRSKSETRNHMNPLDYWYNHNEDLRVFLDQYFTQNIDLLSDFVELRDDVNDMYEKGTAVEKNQALALLSFLKVFFKDYE